MNQKSTGIVRKIDDLGRIVLPAEMRRALDISVQDPVEIHVEGDHIILKSIQPLVPSVEAPDISYSSMVSISAPTVSIVFAVYKFLCRACI